MTIKELNLNLGEVKDSNSLNKDPWFPPGLYGGLYYPQGFYYVQEITWKPSPSAKVELNPGDTLRLNINLSYKGPAQTIGLYAAVGDNSKIGDFFEWYGFNGVKNVSLPEKTILTPITGQYIDIFIPTGHEGEDGAVYIKILNGITYEEGKTITPYYYDAIHIVSITGEFSNFSILGVEKV